ncbi:hypothetical protein PC129_g9381 [Phytophthora cactorum]|uniref:Uncharacterized protein n=1 Tax=Phytophthora cactorum TaxID=29920 RepID=A0A8T1F035_9STRA|nr:hypothetical protein Pcac1_g6209 [Phytophthora cactorum]KAG2958361.1 hypothetical protein PC118_g23566 [Phytophthora cactorum]KAG2974947.1 hypothetical protein PC120_g25923 [Phytophthora cactorum]KAG3042274.1 hypothetical protein PC121_g23152 [Phytophthora cactorum]KAG3219851.1 hypothetical protein PC129_g9381 [Phytophthora cactorum]
MHQPLHGSRSATSAVNSEQSSTPLVAASTAEQEIQPFAPAQLLMRLLSKTVNILFWMPASSLEHVQTEILRKTTKVLGTTEEWIYPVMLAHSNAEFALLKNSSRRNMTRNW